MLVWEAHVALANMLGDPVAPIGSPTVTSIPDGVRFSKALRDEYLHRAMLAIMDKIKATTTQERSAINEAMMKAFPTMARIESFSDTYTGQVTKTMARIPYWIYGVAELRANGRTLAFAPLDPAKFEAKLTLLQTLRTEPMYTIRRTAPNLAQLLLHTDSAYAAPGPTAVNVTYVPVPLHPKTQTPTEFLEYEATLMPNVIGQAAIYGRIDSQDAQSFDSAVMMSKQV